MLFGIHGEEMKQVRCLCKIPYNVREKCLFREIVHNEESNEATKIYAHSYFFFFFVNL
jgi:hypothetical protein